MTFSNKSIKTATPSGLIRLYNGSQTSVAVNNVHKWNSTEDLHGSNVCTVSSGVISLPSGYQYLLQASTCPGASNGYYIETTFQFYNEGTSSYIGTQGFIRGGYSNNQDIYQPLSKDENARVWIDASGASVSVSLRFVALGGDATGRNIDQVTRYNGHSRCLIWRFD